MAYENDDYRKLKEAATYILTTKTGIGLIPPFYAETASVKGDETWPYWIVRNKSCNSLGGFLDRVSAEELAAEMNRQAGGS
jgi:hypothetical protein